MAQELDGLEGIEWCAESAVRDDVAHHIESEFDAQEQHRLKQSWAELHAIEDQLEQLHRQNTKDEAVRFQMKQLERDAEAKGKAIRALQRESEERKAARSTDNTRKPTPAQPTATKTVVKQEQQNNTQNKMVKASSPMITQRKPSMSDYRGGGRVPPASHRLPNRRTAEKYLDDGDEALFTARQKHMLDAASNAPAAHPNARKRSRRDLDESGSDSSASSYLSSEASDAERSIGMNGTQDSVVLTPQDAQSFVSVESDISVVHQVAPGVVYPTSVHRRLLDYQQEGIEWLVDLHRRRKGGVLGDEMGLGKTVQLCAFLNALHSSNLLEGSVLIVAPLTVLSQWIYELHLWCPRLRSSKFHRSSSHAANPRELILQARTQPQVIVTTYAALAQKNDLLQQGGFQYLVLDEGHKISNPEAQVTAGAKSFPTPHRLILSGSPIQNTLKELWCLFDFAVPGLLGTQARFIEEFETPIHASKNPQASALEIATATECARALRRHLQPYLLRRLKKDVHLNLPPKHERIIRCPLSDEQLSDYAEILTDRETQALLTRSMTSLWDTSGPLDRHNRNRDGVLFDRALHHGFTKGMQNQRYVILTKLQHVCNHSDIYRYRYAGSDGDDDSGAEEQDPRRGTKRKTTAPPSFRSSNPVSYGGSSKLNVLRQLLHKWKASDHKVLVFSQGRMMLDILENMCEQEHFQYIRMDGTTPAAQRPLLIDQFNQDPSLLVALLTTGVGGLGVNLTGADRVIIFDPDWNPIKDEQAKERAWRIGQKREVCVYRMITSGTIEEMVLHRQLVKTYVRDKVLMDPSIQRFFSSVNLTDGFYLGAEYRHRLPSSQRHLIAPCVNIADEDDDEIKREEEEDNEGMSRRATTRSDNGVRVTKETKEQRMPVKRRASAAWCRPNDDDDQPRHPDETKILQDLVDGVGGEGTGASMQAGTLLLARDVASKALRRVVTAKK